MHTFASASVSPVTAQMGNVHRAIHPVVRRARCAGQNLGYEGVFVTPLAATAASTRQSLRL